MYTKEKIFNIALSDLLLSRQITNVDTDTSNENKVLKSLYDVAFRSTLEELDLDSTSTQAVLELLDTDPTDFPEWKYVYKYPVKCAFFRRIKSCEVRDNANSQIPKLVRMFGEQKAIFTNEEDAIAEIIAYDVPLSSLDAATGLCIAARLGELAAPLIVGKGAERLKKELAVKFVRRKAEAQKKDANENFNYDDPAVVSEFVEARLS